MLYTFKFTDNGTNSSGEYKKAKTVGSLVDDSSVVLVDGEIVDGPCLLNGATFGESGQRLIAIRDSNSQIVACVRPSANDAAFAGDVPTDPWKVYATSEFTAPSQSPGVVGVIENLLICAERLKRQGW